MDARINAGPTVKLILDTGAGGTLISPRALAASGVSLTRGTRVGRSRGIAKDVEVEVTQVVIDHGNQVSSREDTSSWTRESTTARP